MWQLDEYELNIGQCGKDRPQQVDADGLYVMSSRRRFSVIRVRVCRRLG